MVKSDSPFASLIPHPDIPSGAARSVTACAEPVGPDSLRFRYVLEADLQFIRIPPRAADAGRTDPLWAHTCFEAFVALPGSPRYLELNFSPSGQWAAYGFDSYRQGMTPVLEEAPRLALQRSAERLELQAEVQLGGSLSSPEPVRRASGGRSLRIALSTVVEDRDGRLSYWALRHPPGRPDFHHPESFSLALELPSHPLDSP
ncbi:MAG TPA: DOMON-like domain-containing protein [Steroidobacteraceae bacterium]|jgi:hypothetical protein